MILCTGKKPKEIFEPSAAIFRLVERHFYTISDCLAKPNQIALRHVRVLSAYEPYVQRG